jgi:acetyl esterase/lipase
MFTCTPFDVPLWPQGHPSYEGDQHPYLTVYRASPEYRTGQFVIICPGGAYIARATDKEGHRPAQLLASHGISAAILAYRVAPNRYPLPQSDAQRAIRLVRQQAASWGLSLTQVGIMGFSAGGHLAGSVSVLPELPESRAQDEADAYSCIPDLAMLIYPVVTLTGEFAHPGSRKHLLGENPGEMAERLSLQNLVHSETPPTFLYHGASDSAVPPQNSFLYADQMCRHKRPVDLYLCAGVEHGEGLGANQTWGQLLLQWLDRQSKSIQG